MLRATPVFLNSSRSLCGTSLDPKSEQEEAARPLGLSPVLVAGQGEAFCVLWDPGA